MYEELYILDNNVSGIGAFKPGTDEIIKLRPFNGIFRNKNLLDAELYRSKITNYDLGFILDGNFVPYSKVQQIDYDLYQTFIDGEVIDIIPTYRDRVFKAGYFSFTEDPNVRITDYVEGREINKKLYAATRSSAAHLLKNGTFRSSCIDESLSKISFNNINISPMKYRVYENTTTLRLMRGFELVKVNEFRKYIEEKALPFLADKDKYKNIYFCDNRS